MIDYEKIVDDVRNSLFVQDEEDADFLRSIVADYAVACEEVNERLQQCESLMRRGLRSEALHLCELEPNLLDAVAALDFPEREQWDACIEQYGLISPVPLNLEAAEALSEAYATEKPMARLLHNHRLLALSHGPLRARIRVLRELAKADPENPVWVEDIESFELERLNQLRGEARAAETHGDLTALKRLHAEVHDPGWRNPPDALVVETVNTAHSRVLHAHAHRRMSEVEQELNNAFSAFDVGRGRELRSEWNALADTDGLTVDGEVAARAAPALEWLEEQDQLEDRHQRHLSAVASLERGLDRRQRLDKLERLYHAATSGGEDLTPALERRYQSRVAGLRLSASRRMRLLVLGVTGALILAGVGVWWAIDLGIRRAHVAHVKETLEELVEADDLQAAEKFIAQLDEREPWLLAEPAIAALDARVEDLVDEENSRQTRFERAVDRVRQSLEGDDPASISPNMTSLAAAENLARTPSEKATVADLTRSVEQNQAEVRQQKIDKLREECELLETRIAFLERRGYSELERYGPALAIVRPSIESLRSAIKELQVPGLFGHREKDFTQRVADIEKWIEKATKEKSLCEKIDRAVGDCEAYSNALTAYSDEFELTPRGLDFSHTVDDQPAWEAIVRLSRLNRDWAKAMAGELVPAEASRLQQELEKFVQQAPWSEGDDNVISAAKARIPFLAAVGRRNSSDAKAAFTRIISQPAMQSCWYVERANPKQRYYVLKQPMRSGDSLRFTYVYNAAGERKTRALPASTVTTGAAPQVELGAQLRSLMDELNDTNWERTWFAVIQEIESDQAVDPLLRFDLLRLAVNAACDGSQPMTVGFRRHKEAFNRTEVNLFANWLDPESVEANDARQQARVEFRRMPSSTAAWQTTQQELNKLVQPPGEAYRWVGWLRRDLRDNWEALLSEESVADGQIYGFINSQKGPERVEVGRVRQGDFAAVPNQERLREGMPLFVLQAAIE